MFFDLAPIHYAYMQNNRDPRCSVQLERELFGIDHSAVGAKFGDIWGLPDESISAIAKHHDEISETCDPMLRRTWLANELAKDWGVGQPQEPTQCERTAKWLTDAGPAVVEDLQMQACEQFGELQSLLSS